MSEQFMNVLFTTFQKVFPIALSFVDDALILVLSKIGVHLPGLQWLGTALLILTILYWTVRLIRFWLKSVQCNA